MTPSLFKVVHTYLPTYLATYLPTYLFVTVKSLQTTFTSSRKCHARDRSCLFCLDSAASLKLNQQELYMFGQIQTSQTGGQLSSDTSLVKGLVCRYIQVVCEQRSCEYQVDLQLDESYLKIDKTLLSKWVVMVG